MTLRNLSLFVLSMLLLGPGASCQQKSAPAAPGTEKWSIRGTVVDSKSGSPLSQVEVSLIPVTPIVSVKDAKTIIAGGDGHFLFENVAAGKYQLRASYTGYVRELYEAHDGYNVAITVGPGAVPPDVVFRLRREAAISGKVIDDHNEPVSKATVRLIQAGVFNGRKYSIVRDTAYTNNEGEYEMRPLPPGKYFLSVSAVPWYAQRRNYLHGPITQVGPVIKPDGESRTPALDVAYPTTFYPDATSLETAAPIVLAQGDVITATITMRPTPSAYVRVPIPGVDLEHASITVSEPDTFWGAGAVFAQIAPGVVEIGGLAPGHYRIRMGSHVAPGTAAVTWRELDVSSRQEVTLAAEGRLRPVSGHVEIQPAISLLPELGVALRNQDSGIDYSVTVSRQATFEIKPGVPPGTYDVLLGGGVVLQSMSAKDATVAGLVVEIREGSTPELALVATQALSLVDGMAFKDDKPFAGAMMVLVPEDPLHHPQLFRRDESDSDGTFAFRSVPPGRYTILALENGWDLEWGDPKVWQPLLEQGTPVQVDSKQRYRLRVKIQKPKG